MTFSQALAEQRWDDHRYYHHNRINQSLHLVSALAFIVAYALLFVDPAAAVLLAWLVAMPSRQIGHFFFEPQDYDEVNQATPRYKEAIKVGYNLRRKAVLLSIWVLSPLLLLASTRRWAGCCAPARGLVRSPSRRGDVAGGGFGRACCSARCTCSSCATCRPAWSGSPRSSPTRSTT